MMFQKSKQSFDVDNIYILNHCDWTKIEENIQPCFIKIFHFFNLISRISDLKKLNVLGNSSNTFSFPPTSKENNKNCNKKMTFFETKFWISLYKRDSHKFIFSRKNSKKFSHLISSNPTSHITLWWVQWLFITWVI